MDEAPLALQLPPELRAVLAAELAAGNEIADHGPGLAGPGTHLVVLRYPFRASSGQRVPTGLLYHEINDPHWWKAEFVHMQTKDCLACRF